MQMRLVCECERKLTTLCEALDSNEALECSQAVLLRAYICSMPPKRAEVSTIAIFQTEPTAPNYIVLDAATMPCLTLRTSL